MGSVKRGILLLALGHENYKAMAVNLAASIKLNSPQTKVAVIHDGMAIDSALFDHAILIEAKHPGHMYKTKLYDLTPFDKTLYLDVDMILVPEAKPDVLFDELDGVPFTVMNVQKEYSPWADVTEIRKASGNNNDPFYAYYSEAMYFEKGKPAKDLFALASKQFKVKFENREFNGGVADELALTLAAMKLGIQPHKANWRPVFWHFRDKQDAGKQPFQLKGKYLAYSIGGNSLPAYVKANYNNLATFYGRSMGVAKPYMATDKRYFLANRTTI